MLLFFRQDVDSLQAVKTKRERNLHTLQASRGNRLERFGVHMPKLVQAIETKAQLGKFHNKPIGPLGKCQDVLGCTLHQIHFWLDAHNQRKISS